MEKVLYKYEGNLVYQTRVDGDEKYISIYDTIEEKYLANNLLYVCEIGNVIILKDPKTQKYHLFNKTRYREEQSIFQNAHDEIQILTVGFEHKKVLSLSLNGKKALYSFNDGLITPYEFSNIESIGDIIVFTCGNKKYFELSPFSSDSKKSALYDEIWCEPILHYSSERLIYCKRGLVTDVYYANISSIRPHFELAMTVPFEDIKYIGRLRTKGLLNSSYKYVFETTTEGKKGLISSNQDKWGSSNNVYRNIVGPRYISIKKIDSGNIVPKQDTENRDIIVCVLDVSDIEKDLIRINGEDRFVGKGCKNIAHICGTYFVLFQEENSIINVLDGKTIVNGIKIISGHNPLIYEKGGKQYLFHVTGDGEYKISDGYDEIKDLSNRYYLVTLNGKQGLIHNNRVIINPEYKKMSLKDGNNVVCISLEKEDGSYDIGKYYPSKGRVKLISKPGISCIRLCKNIIVLKDSEQTYVYSYQKEEPLKIFPLNTEIVPMIIGINDVSTEGYMVDGETYLYMCEDDKNSSSDETFFKAPEGFSFIKK